MGDEKCLLYSGIFCNFVFIKFSHCRGCTKSFQKMFWYEKRKEKRPIWQVGIGFIFFLSQIGVIMVFSTGLTHLTLGGMPLFFVIAFMNAFIMTVIYEEIFHRKERVNNVSQ